jgi:hypothetical protein
MSHAMAMYSATLLQAGALRLEKGGGCEGEGRNFFLEMEGCLIYGLPLLG